MQPLLDLVRRTIRQHDLMGPETRVVVALSGGSDSVALAHLLRELDAAAELHVAGVAHFNHRLRAAADDDERFSVHVAQSLGWPCVIEREDVADRARRERRSLEDAARRARHEFFERARLHLGADRVAVGHTRDDQAETFLLRLLRGAGPRGLAAMHPRTGSIVRPLLDCRRADLRAYLADRGIGYVDDESNGDVAIPRNRVRAELLPLLEQRFNPSIVDALANEAALAREQWEWMESAAESLESQVSSLPNPVALPVGSAEADFRLQTSDLDIAALNVLPRALRRLMVWRAMTEAAHGRTVAFGHVEAALRLIDPARPVRELDESSSIDAPGHRVQRIGSRLVLQSRPEGTTGRLATRPTNGSANLFHVPLSIPGEVVLPEAGWLVSVEAGSTGLAAPEIGETSGGDVPGAMAPVAPVAAVAVVRRDLCRGPLAVRNRRPGDWFTPVGLGGTKKLQDYFVDRKVARARRDMVPLVVDETDRIVWVAGFGIDEAFRVTDPAQAVLTLKLKMLGGSA